MNTSQNQQFALLWEKACNAGSDAVAAAVQAGEIQAMTVIAGNKQYRIPDGPCGFAWVEIRPSNSKFANWLKKNKLASYSEYNRCVMIWVSSYQQSLQKKEIFAHAFADVIRAELFSNPLLAGVRVSVGSRLD